VDRRVGFPRAEPNSEEQLFGAEKGEMTNKGGFSRDQIALDGKKREGDVCVLQTR